MIFCYLSLNGIFLLGGQGSTLARVLRAFIPLLVGRACFS